jgi:hypothetical protein
MFCPEYARGGIGSRAWQLFPSIFFIGILISVAGDKFLSFVSIRVTKTIERICRTIPTTADILLLPKGR